MPIVSDCTAAIDTLPVFWREAAVAEAGAEAGAGSNADAGAGLG